MYGRLVIKIRKFRETNKKEYQYHYKQRISRKRKVITKIPSGIFISNSLKDLALLKNDIFDETWIYIVMPIS